MFQNKINRLKPGHDFRIKSKDKILGELFNDNKAVTIAARIVKHEIGDRLIGLSRIEYCLKKKSGDFQTEIDILNQTRQSIENGINLLSNNNPSRIPLSKIIRQIVPISFCSNTVSNDIYVKFPFLLFISFIQNISDNAVSAFQKKNGGLDGFRLSFRMEEKSLFIEDNSGGFDISKIRLGKSTTGGRGIFLAVFLNDADHLGIKSHIERIENGTRITITFDTVECETTTSKIDQKSSN